MSIEYYVCIQAYVWMCKVLCIVPRTAQWNMRLPTWRAKLSLQCIILCDVLHMPTHHMSIEYMYTGAIYYMSIYVYMRVCIYMYNA